MDMIKQLKQEIVEVKEEELLAAIFGDKEKVKLCKEVIAQNERLIAMLESRKK